MSYNDIRFRAEWEPIDGVLLALPHSGTDWAFNLTDVIGTYKTLIDAMIRQGENVLLLCRSREEAKASLGKTLAEKIHLIEADYNDTWTRDYGPISLSTASGPEARDFGFNGWGLKFAADCDNLVNLQLAEKGIIPFTVYSNQRDFILEGGSIETDGRGTLLTTSRCLCSPNRNGGKCKEDIETILKSRLNVNRILWLDYGALEGDDTDSHIDTLARFAPNNTITFTACDNQEDSHYNELLNMRHQLQTLTDEQGLPFTLIALPLPDPIYDEDGNRLPATYSNYLVTPRCIYMPTYSQPQKDALASQLVSSLFPGLPIEQIDCTPLIRQHGSLHCSTMQIGTGILNPSLK